MFKTKFNYLIVILFLFSILFCSSDKKSKEQAESEIEYSVSSGLEGQKSDIKINFDSLLIAVDRLTNELTMDITNLTLKKQLMLSCIDTVHGYIYASGRGTPLSNARNQTLAMNYAKKAAIIDAYRWAAHIKRWQSDIAASIADKIMIDSIKGTVVSQAMLPDNTIQVLVQVAIDTIP